MVRRSTVAAAGLSAGTLLVVAGGAPAAMAVPAPNGPCDNAGEHIVATPPFDDSFYDCVPLYGMGKVSFTVENPDGLPAEFNLADPGVTTYAPSTAGAGTYFGAPSETGFGAISQSNSTATTRGYTGDMFFPVGSVTPLVVADAPASCVSSGEVYDFAYRVTYLPASVTFTTTAGSVEYQTVVSDAPAPLDLYLNASSGAFEAGEPQCATNGTATLIAASSGEGEFQVITEVNAEQLSPFPLAFTIFTFTVPAPAPLGDFVVDELEPAPPTEPAAGPTLAETGSKPAYGLFGLSATLLAAGGVALGWASRRRLGAHAAR